MLIATWNVNSVRARLELVLEWLESHHPDLLCLQETKVKDYLFPVSAFKHLGYYVQAYGQSSYNGVAFISKKPLEDIRLGFTSELPKDPEAAFLDRQKRIISGIFKDIRVVNLYVPNGSDLGSKKYLHKLAWLSCLRRYLVASRRREEPLCVLGDFNIALEARDIYNSERFTGGLMASGPERRALHKALDEGLWDMFRVFESEPGHWSWWDYRSGAWERNQGWRIDYIYFCKELMDRTRSCAIDAMQRGRLSPSDHVPVLVNLDWPIESIDGDGTDYD